MILSLAGVLIANAAGVVPTALQIPPWKIPPPSMAPPGPALHPTWPIPVFTAGPEGPCVNPGFTLPTGIVATHQGPFATQSFEITTMWRGWVGTDLISVYAGATSRDGQASPDLAAVRMYEENENASHCG